MLTFRSTRIFPEAVGEVIAATPEASGEYVCLVEGSRGSETMTVLAETSDGAAAPAFDSILSSRISAALGFDVLARTMERGALDDMTGIAGSAKIKRLLDRRTD